MVVKAPGGETFVGLPFDGGPLGHAFGDETTSIAAAVLPPGDCSPVRRRFVSAFPQASAIAFFLVRKGGLQFAPCAVRVLSHVLPTTNQREP